MDFATVDTLDNRKQADVLVIPFWKTKKHPKGAADCGKLLKAVNNPIEIGDFTGKEGEVLFLYLQGQPEQRIALLGLGDEEKVTIERLRRAFGSLTKACRPKKIRSANVLTPIVASINPEEVIRGVAEGLLLANYVFEKLKFDAIKDESAVLLDKVTFIGASQSDLKIARKYGTIAESVYLARDLVNSNADEVTPQYLGLVAQRFSKELPHVKTTILDKKQIEKEKMGLILAVSRGSVHDPLLIVVEYRGNPKSKDCTVLVGKGVTYDTGGLNLKPPGSGMETMKCDMGGAATVLATLYAAAKLGLKVNVTAVVPSVENAISATSYKPGDVYQSYSGKTVEIGNTDAEGRLILADAFTYVSKYLKPSRIIDFATLTGSMEIALGNETIGMMSTNDALADSLLRSGLATYERLCRLPVYEEYREQLKSDFADMKNIGGRPAGCITAALFLKEFIENDVPWAHCDIAGTAYLSEARRYHPKHGTGVGVRLMLEFLENL